jgi:PAS domain S-box-containing protein
MMYPNVAVILTDAKRRIQWINDDFTLLTGYALQEVIGRKPSILQGRKTADEDIERLRQGLESKKPFKDSIINYTKYNEEYLCQFVIYPIFDDDNNLTNYIAFEVDGNRTNEANIPLMQLRDRYQTSSLKDSDQTTIYIRLSSLMLQEKLYLNPDLTLKELAVRLSTNTRYLSQVINTLSGFNLQHFINTHRIEEVKRKMLQPEYHNLTLYGVSQHCGFKNKSTFYKVFKEVTGLTPKDFIRQEEMVSN